jgi:hypothetical protein
MYPLVVSPAGGFGPVVWDGAQGAAALAVLNCSGLFVAVKGDTGELLDVIPPYTRALVSFDGFAYSAVQLQDASLGSITAPTGITGSTIYVGADKRDGTSFQAPFAVGSY